MAHESDIELFHAVLDAGSFSGAARALGMTHSAVSKRIGSLESRLGSQLLVRSTRQMKLTNAGELYASETRDLLARLKAVETEVAEGSGNLRGRIRVTTSNALGQQHVVPAVLAFMERYPEVLIDLTLTDQVVDIVRDQIDLAVRSAHLPDSSLIARKLVTNRRLVCASPVYLAARGTPLSPDDLKVHSCLSLNLQGAYNDWGLLLGETQRLTLGNGFACNSLETLRTACRQGHGVARLPMFLVAQDIEDGTLVPVLEEYRDPSRETAITIVRPDLSLVPKRTRMLSDFIVDWFRDLNF